MKKHRTGFVGRAADEEVVKGGTSAAHGLGESGFLGLVAADDGIVCAWRKVSCCVLSLVARGYVGKGGRGDDGEGEEGGSVAGGYGQRAGAVGIEFGLGFGDECFVEEELVGIGEEGEVCY